MFGNWAERMPSDVSPGGRFLAAIHGMSTRVLDLLYPPQCVACDADMPEAGADLHLCVTCREALVGLRVARCTRCAAPSAVKAPLEGCVRCRRTRLRFDAAFALGDYHGMLRETVLRTKHPHEGPLTSTLGRLLAECLRENLEAWRPEVIVSIPMHWQRRLMRGANGPDTLALAMANGLRIPIETQALVRRRNTSPHSRLPPSRRFENIRGAFALRSGYDLQGARVMLVDDVLTTGATTSEAARQLKRAGAAAVAAVVLARAPGDG